MTNSYDLLSRDMRKYIFEKGWPSLTKIQDATIKHIFATDNNLILAAPTASGKTEAAFLPTISKSQDIKTKLKILYISPLIALINDQFKRISEMCEDFDIGVTSWHSEASVSQKEKLLENPTGILLITPESLEAMLVSDKERACVLFKNLDFIIVDEIHGFLDTNRGLQLKSLLVRLYAYTERPPRMLGLSATIGDKNYDLAKSFFLNGRETNILLDRSKNDLKTSLDYIECEDVNEEIARKILEYALGKSTLVFPNSRAKVEKLSYLLKKLVAAYDIRVFSHHSSISKLKRTEIENFAKTSRSDFIIVATSTLELGIDIGAVDQVIQVGSPASVLSLSQRLGRSGRRTRKSVIHQIATDKWDLVQALAALRLFEEGRLDKIDIPKKSYDIFAHQVLSTLLEKNGLLIEDFYKLNHDLKSFSDISDEEFRILTDFLLEKDFVEEIDGEYIVGKQAEKLMTMGSFYNQFVSKKTYRVQTDKQTLGEIELGENLRVADRIYLSGQVWKIEAINHKSRKIKVSLSDKANARSFAGVGGFEISGEIRAKMEEILLHPLTIDLDNQSKKIINDLAKELKNESYHFVDRDGKTGLRTFRSTMINKTLALILNIKSKSLDYYVEDKSSTLIGPSIKRKLEELRENPPEIDEVKDFLIENSRLIDGFISLNKFMVLVPNALKATYIIENILDIEGAKEYLQNL
ncbi:DEAD/DEAH box helicase [Anaerococcus lactolyticus]|uniref:DEAD/DEAH box helicase n=1 Tax=Anaerococcus lactolyticus S7-1-13 TaxID=1284686 RepID=A0A095X3Y5_9FIRM|nr:DEAD/DEAH box helicase [Anaerococcus lactolyticus]KGF04563.1 DEAD/DEAH box helicase [Anaerococcus lactolyticus S7-1-13]